MIFQYRARDLHGALITGQLEATAEAALAKLLAAQGLIPIAFKKVAAGFRLPSFDRWFLRSVKAEEILVFTRQFQTLFKAGLGMDSILSALIRQCQNKGMKEVLQRIRNDVSGGSTLAQAFSNHPRVFKELYVNMLGAGEEAGILDQTLHHLADLLEKETSLKASIKSATLYPKIVVFVLMIAGAILMTFVVPKFAAFYANYKVALPIPTLLLLKTSQFLTHQWYVLVLLGIFGASVFRWFKRSSRGRFQLAQWSLRIPVFGPLRLRVANARFCHILSALYRSGLPITRALEITGGTLDNDAFRRELELLKGDLTRGISLSEGMIRSNYFTPVIQEAVAAGEKAGSLDEMLESVGSHYDMEVGHTVKNLTTLLEPILLFLIFGMVGFFALAIFLPVWNMSQLVTSSG